MNDVVLVLAFSLGVAACSGGADPTDLDARVRQAACMHEAVSGTAFTAGADVASAGSHALTSSDTPYTIALPAGHDGFVGFHVAERHTTIDVIVRHAGDVGAITQMGGMPSDILFSQDAITGGVAPAPSCTDLYVYRLHVDVPGDFELQLPSNAVDATWMVFQITQVGHDLAP